jgi:hypothetical protein
VEANGKPRKIAVKIMEMILIFPLTKWKTLD